MRIWFLVGLLCVAGSGCSDGNGGSGGNGGDGGNGGVRGTQAELTFLGIAMWLVQYGETTVLLDAYFSRPGMAGAEGSTEEGLDLMQRVLDAAGVESVDFILVGHSHFDHAIDCGSAAMRTGAQVVGTKTTCLVAQAAGLPEDRCTVVDTGDELQLGEATMRAARTIHFLPGSIGRFAELEEVPTPAETWAAPVGGPLSYLITFPGEEPFSLFHTSSIAPIDGDDESGEDYVANLDATFSDIDGTTLWIAPVGFLSEESRAHGVLLPNPSGVRNPATLRQPHGRCRSRPNDVIHPVACLDAGRHDEGATILVPEEYFDVFIVSPDGVTKRR